MKSGPSLGGYGAVAMNAALRASMTTLTWDRGKELCGLSRDMSAWIWRTFREASGVSLTCTDIGG